MLRSVQQALPCGSCPACALRKEALLHNWTEVLPRIGGCFNPIIKRG